MQALQNCPPPPSPSPLLQSALEREVKAIRAQKELNQKPKLDLEDKVLGRSSDCLMLVV